MTEATLVIIDDDPQITAVLKAALSHQGYSAHTSHSGEEALGVLRHHRPDAVLLDLNMPGMCGADVLEQMQADRELSQVPVILTTGEKDGPELAGVFATVSKPFPLDLLYSTVRRALDCGD